MSNPKPNVGAPRDAAWIATPRMLTEAQERDLQAIDPRDSFLRAIKDIAGEYDAEVGFFIGRRGKTTPGQYRAALRALIAAGSAGGSLLPTLDWLTRGRVEAQAFATFGTVGELDLWARQHPDLLLVVAERLLVLDGGKNREKANGAEIYAAWQLRQVFARFGIEFTAYDGGTLERPGPPRQGGAAARCLRVVIRVAPASKDGRTTGNVEHILTAALGLPALGRAPSKGGFAAKA
jgi:hypothetical protein